MGRLTKLDKIYDSYIDMLNYIDNTNGSKDADDYIYEIQRFIYECLQHKVLTQKEYEELYTRFKACLSENNK
jgi:hypothetical protein